MSDRRVDAIDCSHYNVVDFDALPPLQAFITKATQGTSRIDPVFIRYRDDSRRAGIPRRIWYHFVTGDDAETQARFFATTVGPLQSGEGVMLDVESDLPRGVGTLHWDHICEVADRITALLHVVPFIYVGLYYPGSPPPAKYPWILPHYGSPHWASMSRQPCVWQWSSEQHVPGVAGNCDVNTILDLAAFDAALFGHPHPDPVRTGGTDMIEFLQLDDTHPPAEHDPVWVANLVTQSWVPSQEDLAIKLFALGWPADYKPRQLGSKEDLGRWGVPVGPMPPGWTS